MKKTIYLILGLLAGIYLPAQAQENNWKEIKFPVSGNCEMCKERIENAAKGRGVRVAVWDMETKLLTLTYDSLLTKAEKVQARIAEAGHDAGNKKAPDGVYAALPECCLYRDGDGGNHPEGSEPLTGTDTRDQQQVRGVVLEEDNKGNFRPLPGASITWLDTRTGTQTDSSGVFRLTFTGTTGKLVISYAGFRPDTIVVQPATDIKIILASNQQLAEVRLTSRLRSTYVSSLSTLRTQVMTEKELFKAACCNLSESFETNPSVDVSYNDAVTGSKQIQLLGLSGNYTQLTVENMPGPRGIATPLGLNSISGTWVESIQLNKGVGSVVNGFESIAGQINIELKKARKAEPLYANLYVNANGKTDLNLNLARQLGKKWGTVLLLHDDFFYNRKMDFNKDGYRDLPTGNLFSVMNRWEYEDGKGVHSEFGFKVLTDNRTGGETMFIPAKDRNTTNYYGLGFRTRRYEGFAKTGYVFPGKKYKSFGLQLQAFHHRQDAYFGLREYDAEQRAVYANFIYQSIIGNSNHKFRTGLSFTGDRYREVLRNLPYNRNEAVPGGFFEYSLTAGPRLSLVAGIRTDHNNLYGWFVTPRMHIRYVPFTGTTLRISAGRGQRTANIFAENMTALVSERDIVIMNGIAGKAYGLDPEIAWNKGISADQRFRLFNREASLALDFYRNDFSSQVITDIETSGEVRFYNLAGKSFSNSFQAELNLEPLYKLELRLAWRYFDVRSTYGGALLQKPLTARHRAFANLAYEVRGWKFDYTINYNGKKRVPSTSGNPPAYTRQTTSPSYWLMNAQISKTVGKKHPVDLYLGGENLTHFFQPDPIIAGDQPFSPYFDASLVWGPVGGRMIYAGLRYKIK